MQGKYCVVVTLCVVIGAAEAAAQNTSILPGIFGRGASAPAEQAWRKVPRNEIGCIERGLAPQRSTVQSMIQTGVMPTDPRLAQLRTFCHGQTAPQTAQPGAAPASPYVVDKLALGARLQLDGAAYREYRCAPSEQFQGFTWCQKQRQEKKPVVSSSNSILHGQDGTAVYLNRSVEPATFERGGMDKEIDKLSAKYGERAKVMRMPATAGVDGTAVIAQWGQVELEPLKADELADLAAGKEVVQGLRVDYLGDFTRSAKLGLPVYRIAGGPGFVWAASSDQKGRGHLRQLASDASAYGQPGAPPPAAEVAQVAKPDPPEQPGVAAAKTEADDTQKTLAEAGGATVEAGGKTGPGEGAPAPAKANPDAAVTEPPTGATDGARGRAEAATNYPLMALGGGLLVVAAGAAFVMFRRRNAKELPQAHLQEFVPEPRYPLDNDAPIVPITTGLLAERVSEPPHTEDLDALIDRAIGNPATDGDAVPAAQAAERAGLSQARCAVCGHDVPSVARVCTNCGSPIDPPALDHPGSPPRSAEAGMNPAGRATTP
jgi:hypothetical protein